MNNKKLIGISIGIVVLIGLAALVIKRNTPKVLRVGMD